MATSWARQGSNLGPTDYESAALPAELRALGFDHRTTEHLWGIRRLLFVRVLGTQDWLLK